MSSIDLEEMEAASIRDVEWYMMDKWKYYPSAAASSMSVRTILYPVTLVRARLQYQTGTKRRTNRLVPNNHGITNYNGTWHALRSIYHREGGVRALYRGCGIYNLQLFPGIIYITTFERFRYLISNMIDSRSTTNTNEFQFDSQKYTAAMLGGAAASAIAQTMVVPLDIVSQQLMLLGQLKLMASNNLLKFPSTENSIAGIPKELILKSTFRPNRKTGDRLLDAKQLTEHIYRKDGIRGFYRGFILSTVLFGTNSAVWWPFYFFWQKQVASILPEKVPNIIVQLFAGPLASFMATVLTNPFDVCRTRIQLQYKSNGRDATRKFYKTFVNLWKQEGVQMVFKGLTARLTHSCVYSMFIIFGYETVKRISLKDEYKEMVKW
ncbi:hypothetical protein SNEBB_004184 [Seison nebaliae]|nr:hypothetical protein SNEBB_004184 [Seison nebaliae]